MDATTLKAIAAAPLLVFGTAAPRLEHSKHKMGSSSFRAILRPSRQPDMRWIPSKSLSPRDRPQGDVPDCAARPMGSENNWGFS